VLIKTRGKKSKFLPNRCFQIHAISIADPELDCYSYCVAGPYILDFLGLKDTYAEKDLEAAILREMEAFLLELGVGFCFMARQQRMQIDDRDYYLDLLFYHRKLRRSA
jgi:predicted nuclease of restriction endonuclease-like (RecB) superfamily